MLCGMMFILCQKSCLLSSTAPSVDGTGVIVVLQTLSKFVKKFSKTDQNTPDQMQLSFPEHLHSGLQVSHIAAT